MEALQTLLENSQYAVLTAFILGLMTAISPCPLATNISAIGFISRDLEYRGRVFIKGLIYTLGRAVTYTSIGLIIYFGASKMNVSLLFQGWGERLLGPLMILIGLFMLDFINIKFPGFHGMTERMGEYSKRSYGGTLLLGMVFAMAFCPYSGVLYFMILIPMTVASPSGLFLPIIFAIATGLPVVVFAYLLAYAVGNVGKLYNRIRVFELWFRRIVAILFILVGIYYIGITIFNLGI